MCVCMGVCLGRGDNMKKKKKESILYNINDEEYTGGRGERVY